MGVLFQMLGKRRRSSEGRTEDSPSKRTKYDEGFEIYERFEEVISKPELFLSPKQSLQEQLLNLLQQIYSFEKKTEPHTMSPLQKLIVNNMDTEQIWEQLQLFNKPLLKYVDSVSFDQLSDDEKSSSSSDLEEEEEDELDVQSMDGSSEENDNSILLKKPKDIESEESMDEDDEDGGIDWEKMKEGKDALQKKEIRFGDFYKEPEKLSKYQQRKKDLEEKIGKLEEQNVADKPWQLRGEVSGKMRPKESLLEEFVIFDHATKTAPEVTVEKTQDLEDIIKQRIIEESWDDVLPKKIIDESTKTKEKVELDHEKSKFGLAEVYERQYLGLDAEEAERQAKEKYEEITNLFNSICYKLDALSNFHYTPRIVKQDKEEQKNVAAITMEEVLPSAVSDASLLAPEEVYSTKKKPVKGESELTSEDKKAKRRAKKSSIRKQRRAEEADRKLIEKINPGLGNKYTKQAAIDNLKTLRKSKNVQFASGKGPGGDIKYTQSTAFFKKLQQDAQIEISKSKGDSNKNKKQNKS